MLRLALLTLLPIFFALATATSPEPSPDTVSGYSLRRFRNLLSFITSPSLASANLEEIRNISFALESQAPFCSPNVCIAFDGSAAVSDATFSTQVQIAQIITAILGGLDDVRFAAVQYGGITRLISRTTERRAPFQSELGASVPDRSPITFVAPALQFCSTQFSVTSGMAGLGPNRIVLLGGAMSTFSADQGPFGVVAIAQQFLARGDNKISALLVGAEPSTEAQIRRVVADGKLVNAVDDAGILAGIAEIISEICT